MVSRRRFIKLATVSTALPLLGNIHPSIAADEMNKVPASDPAAIGLKYVEDAESAIRSDKMGIAASEQICGNCNFYKAGEDAAWGGCALFQNRLVAKAGWCVGWIPVT